MRVICPSMPDASLIGDDVVDFSEALQSERLDVDTGAPCDAIEHDRNVDGGGERLCSVGTGLPASACCSTV